jgi:pyruvate,water dikinase
MMAELPSNALLIREFCAYFDGFSIGSNDLTQTTLGVDRDSTLLSALFDETDEAVVTLLDMLVHGAKKRGKPIGICGQAPSDYPALAHYLIKQGISSVSLNPDAVIPFLEGGKNGAYD